MWPCKSSVQSTLSNEKETRGDATLIGPGRELCYPSTGKWRPAIGGALNSQRGDTYDKHQVCSSRVCDLDTARVVFGARAATGATTPAATYDLLRHQRGLRRWSQAGRAGRSRPDLPDARASRRGGEPHLARLSEHSG